MNFLYLRLKITIQIVGITVKDKHKNFHFKNDGVYILFLIPLIKYN